MISKALVLVLVLVIGQAQATRLKHSEWERVSVLSCAIHFSELDWAFKDGDGFYDKLCDYEPAFGSWVSCIHEQLLEVADENAFKRSLANINECCLYDATERRPRTLEQYYSSLHNATQHMKQEPAQPEVLLSYPVKMQTVLRRRLNNAYHSYLRNFDDSGVYGGVLCWYFVAMMGLAAALQIAWVKPWLFRLPGVSYFRGKYILPTLTHNHAGYVQNGWAVGLVPTKLETLMLSGYFLVHTFALCYNYHIDPYNMVFPSRFLQWLRLVADRSAILSFAHFPLIVLFSTRNSILEHWTGFKYTTFIVMHKWIGRCMVIDAIMHGVAYKVFAEITDTIDSTNQQLYWKTGVLALYIGGIICLLSLGRLRQNHYETFLYIHIALAALFFLFCWLHVKEFGWKSWIYVSVGLWVLERFQRVRLILRFGIAKAQLELIGTDLIKMKVPKPHNWHSQPSQYVFIYFLRPTICWQSHPFTFIDMGDELLVVIRAKKGATEFVRKELVRQGGRTSVKVLIEGPYGLSAPLHRFNQSLFLCGGSGLPGPLAYALKMGQSLAQEPNKSLHIVVVTRGLDILQAYMDLLARLKYLNVDLQIYLTGSHKPSYGSIDSTEKQVFDHIDFATIHRRRPDVGSIIKSLVQDSPSLAICCCGPPTFVDMTRNLAADMALNNPTNRAEYFEEYQTW
ncbi:(ZYRO0G07392g) [Zygosaccharomyces parabailii]|uniref:ZYBA0S04-04962g1_1 n=1 Tax=Zygosaccharomyces bailii (strain CLIB 213 / ATCC 58445 / CBS 680 / BCRC 21525 / NBRC 1098 / NCYC 1416 / NRRL Y-2227) TaxID=1333698 RepID=A0A8J2T701_ZYGB2|nr:(ZYRO0G07392g) [Zygosaccharomyces parabailii]CDF89466.1 ZYBA0S04-04962g1_1 [Zygosaccharomyces bailii CLIB 213]CDH08430.1 related to Ferric/cupric reductase transmembrane component 2 [Zygosaccharomyces bailii ISA1307]